MTRPRHLMTYYEKNNNATIHVKNIEKMMIAFYKYYYGVLDPIMKEVFAKRLLKYNLQNIRVTLLPNPKTKKCGTYKITYKAAYFQIY